MVARCLRPTTSLPEGDQHETVTGSCHSQDMRGGLSKPGWSPLTQLKPQWGHALQSKGLLRHCLCCMFQVACQRVLPTALAATADARLSSVMRLMSRCQPLQHSSLMCLSWRRMTATSLHCSLLRASQVSSAGLFTMHLSLAQEAPTEQVEVLQSAAALEVAQLLAGHVRISLSTFMPLQW